MTYQYRISPQLQRLIRKPELQTEHMSTFSAKTNQGSLGLGAKAAKPTVDISRRKNK